MDAQNKPEAVISFVNLRDTIIVKELRYYLKEQQLAIINDSTKQRPTSAPGYLDLLINQHVTGDTLVQYSMSKSYSYIQKGTDDRYYPPYYTSINNNLVLIRFIGSELVDITYSRKSKKQLRKEIEKFLDKPKKAVFTDMQGNKTFTDKNFRVTWFNFHNGRHVYIIKNKAPVIINE